MDFSEFLQQYISEPETQDVEECIVDVKEVKTSSELQLSKNKQKKKKIEFSSEEKKKLASLVETSEAIWKLEHRLHKNNSAVASLWSSIAAEMNKPVEDCKAMWRSLRDSMRYHVTS
ncbi:uncharacterized protein LOC129953665 [Eupeodes corollae]|uniref:uncharacterized protein LOC129953665 n=1 Tax=Eupeodes corollae TaxID=290404 RepID=UPI0024926EAC|nr:uncharacterized protein LOC129953665 [Eupeodes corollae]